MIVARLKVSYDRGTERNAPQDLGLDAEPETTERGGEIRGLGSHWRSTEAKENAARCAAEERRVRGIFARRFVRAPLPGLFVLPTRKSAYELLQSLEILPDLSVSLSVYDLAPAEALPPEEVREWQERIAEQLRKAPLGRASEASEDGLATLEQLAACPVLGQETQRALGEMIAAARIGSVDRAELRRRLDVLPLELELGGETIAPARPLVSEEPSEEPEPDLLAPFRPRVLPFDPPEMSPDPSLSA